MAFLEISGVTKHFAPDAGAAVDDFSLSIERGEFISFLGPSGCGKTTTLRVVAGFEQASAGSVHINGVDVSSVPANRRNVGMVFQAYALFPNMTVAENVGFGLRVAGQPAALIQARVAVMLELIRLPDYARRYPHQLSGGQQQRVALARALAVQPQLLLLDEPLSALDAKIRIELRAEIRRIQQELKLTTIYVTHDQEEALSLSDRIVVMNMGRIEQVGTPFEIYNYPRTAFTASFVGHLNLLPVQVTDAATGACTFEGTPLASSQPAPNKQAGSARLAIRPEELVLNGTGANRLSGRVLSVNFLGNVVRLRVRVGAVELSVDMFNERKLVLPAVDAQVVLSFPAHACWLMD